MKKIFSLLLSVFVLTSILSVSTAVFAQSETLINASNFTAYFDGDEGVLTVDGKDAMYFFTESSFADALEITSYSIEDVKKVKILEGITVIDSGAFRDMSKLEEVTLPESLVKINANAFKNCRKLKTFNYAGTQEEWADVVVTNRGNNLFLKAKINYSVDVEESEGDYEKTFDVLKCDSAEYDFKTAELKITAKGYIEQSRIVNAWFGPGHAVDYKPICVERLIIGDGVVKLGSDMMASCDSLEYVSIPKSVTTIEKGCFYGCKALKTVYYEGSKDEWKRIRIEDEGNDDFTDADMQFGEEDEVSIVPLLIALAGLFIVSALLVVLATRKRKD